MIYKGVEISENEKVLVEDPPYKDYGSNWVELSLEDLEELVQDYKNAEKELERRGIEFSDLRLNFHGTSYYDNPNGPDEDANMEVYFSYFRPETEYEKTKRMSEKMKWIDKQIEQQEKNEAASKLAKEVEIQQAMKLLEENGYKVS